MDKDKMDRLLFENEVEQRVRRAVTECERFGVLVRPTGEYGVAYDESRGWFVANQSEVCPLGALLLTERAAVARVASRALVGAARDRRKKQDTDLQVVAYHAYHFVVRVLGVNFNWVSAFTAGFDGHTKYLTDTAAKLLRRYRAVYDLGLALRKAAG